MTTTYTLPDGQVIHLYPREHLRRFNPCRTFLLPRYLPKVMAENPLPTPPTIIDWTKGNQLSFKVYGNDKVGDCYYAAACHTSNAQTGNVGTEDDFDLQAVLAAYQKLSGGDNGLSTDEMMGEWKRGLIGGPHKILDDMSIPPTDEQAMTLAMWLFGGVVFTLGIPDKWLQSAAPGVTWDIGTGVSANPNNGHAVLLSGKNQFGYTFETWGFNPPICLTVAGVGICDPEANVVFSLDWFDAQGYAPNKLHYTQVASLWQQLGGNPLPLWVGPVVPPSPPVPPAPTPIPAPTITPLFPITAMRDIAKGELITFKAPVPIPKGPYGWVRLAATKGKKSKEVKLK